MERIEMSQAERDKLEWLKRAKDGVITQREAANKMGVSEPVATQAARADEEARGCGGSTWVARPGIQSQDRGADTETQSLGFESGAFMNAYSGNRAEAVLETL